MGPMIPRLARPLLAGLLAIFAGSAPAPAESPSDLEELARCIANSGAIFYGAHWCPYCRKQKEYFGAYASLLPYVECYAGRKSEGDSDECLSAGVDTFPTWYFPDGTVSTGVKRPRTLARATGCR
jgi:thiol-disulfide isomerase/thioredoxin